MGHKPNLSVTTQPPENKWICVSPASGQSYHYAMLIGRGASNSLQP